MSDRVRLVEDTDGQPPMSVNSLLSDERATFPQTTSTSGDLHPGDHLGCACGNFRLFQIGLERGVTKWNILAYFWAITITISAYVFINACQGYILSNFLGIGEDSQGLHSFLSVAFDCLELHFIIPDDGTTHSNRNLHGRFSLLQ
jgi:hypothetical protein